MPVSISYPKFKAFDTLGAPLKGGKLYSYIAGTSTAKATYSDADLSSANANPTILDAYGEATVYLDGTYNLVLTDANDVEQAVKDRQPQGVIVRRNPDPVADPGHAEHELMDKNDCHQPGRHIEDEMFARKKLS